MLHDLSRLPISAGIKREELRIMRKVLQNPQERRSKTAEGIEERRDRGLAFNFAKFHYHTIWRSNLMLVQLVSTCLEVVYYS